MKKAIIQILIVTLIWTLLAISLSASSVNNSAVEKKTIEIEVPANGTFKKRFVKSKGVKALSIMLSSTRVGKLKTEVTDINGKRVSRGGKSVNVWGEYDKRTTYIFVVHNKSNKVQKVTATAKNVDWVK